MSDIDGDGVTDILIGAPGRINGENGTGEPFSRVHVVLGSPEIKIGARIETGRDQQDITIRFGPGPESIGLGNRVSSGDFNGDGFGDISVGNGASLMCFLEARFERPSSPKQNTARALPSSYNRNRSNGRGSR